MKKLKKLLLILLFSIIALDICFIGFIIKDISIDFTSNNISEIEYSDDMKFKEPTAILKGKHVFKEGKKLELEQITSPDKYILGKNKIEYSAKYLFWKSSFIDEVNIIDKTAPEIILKNNPEIITPYGEKYNEEGFEAFDNYDGDITNKVTTEEKDGFVYYNVSDSSGNSSTVNRKIIYTDVNAPIITFESDKNIVYTQGSKFESPDYTATDDIDGNLTDKVVIDTSKLDMDSVGTYEVVYSVTDKAGNIGITKRIVEIIEKKQEIKNNASSIEANQKVIYLTFDDGPGKYTEKLLNILDKYNVKATFFVVNGKYNDLIKKEYDAGHSVAIHSYTHDYSKIYSSKNAYYEDLNKMREVIYNQTGVYTELVRFPGGGSNTVSRKYCNGIMSELTKSIENDGYVYFDWNVSSGDAGETTSTDKVVSNVINGIKGKNVAVVLQHDIKGFSVDAVEEIIKWGLDNGYTFLPLDKTSFSAHHSVNN